MYAALMTGIGNYLCQNFGYEADQVRYGGTDEFWNKFNLEKVRTPGLIYGSTAITFPNGLSAHGGSYIGNTNTSETVGIRVKVIKFNAAITLGMLADNENDHFDQIHRYVMMAAFNASLKYRVNLPATDSVEVWESTVGEFSELSPAPGGLDSNTYDPEGRIYKLEATFSVQSQFFMTEEQKIVRCVYMGDAGLENSIVGGSVGADSAGNPYPRTRR